MEAVHKHNSVGNMVFYDGVPDKGFLDYLLLKDYDIKKTELKEINGQSFILTSFTGRHDNEYTISEAVDGKVSGRVQLLKRGIIQLSWVIKQEERTGFVSVYDDGVLTHVYSWDYFLSGKDLRVVINGGMSSYLTVVDAHTHKAVYRGQYDPETLARSGNGIEYDSETGDEKYSGIFRDDKLIHISVEFLGDNQLIQYEESERCNLDLFDRFPICIGEYTKVNCMQFDLVGSGKKYNPYTGMRYCPNCGFRNKEGPITVVNSSSLFTPFIYRETSLREMMIPFAVQEYSDNNRKDFSLDSLDIHYTHIALSYMGLRTGDFSLFECLQGVHLNNVTFGAVLRFHSLMRLKTIKMESSTITSLSIVNCPQLKNLTLCKESGGFCVPSSSSSSSSSLIINGMLLFVFLV